MIGNPPNVSVPTHFAKVVLAKRPASPSTPHIPEVSTGAFLLPNAVIPDDAALESFVVPGTLESRFIHYYLLSDIQSKLLNVQLVYRSFQMKSRHLQNTFARQQNVRLLSDVSMTPGKGHRKKSQHQNRSRDI